MDGLGEGSQGFKSDHLYITPKQLMNELSSALIYHGFDQEKVNDIEKHCAEIYCSLIGLLNGITFEVDRTNLKQCRLEESTYSDGRSTYKSLELQIHLIEYSQGGNALESRNGRLHLNIFRPVVAGFMIEPVAGSLELPTSGYLHFT